jgi:uncharacterized protein
MLHFEGEKEFRRPVADVWAKLSDARFLVECVPGVETVVRAEPTEAVWTLRPGLSFVRGTLEITLKVVEAVRESSVRLTVTSKGIGSSSDVEAVLRLTPEGDGTRVAWTADVKSLGGLLKALPQGLLKASAQKVIGDIWAAVEAKLT